MGLLDASLGPLLIGSFASVFAFGIMVVQCYLYFLWYKSDRIFVKMIVAFLLFLDTVTTGFNIAGIYTMLVSNFDNILGLSNENIGLLPYPLFTGITALVVQCFFGWRIWVLTGFRFISISIYVLSVVQFLLSIGVTVAAALIIDVSKELEVDAEFDKVVLPFWLSVSLLVDLIITVTLVFWLRKSRTGWNVTDDVITRFIRMTVQTGLLTTSFAIVVIVTSLASANTTVYIAFGLPLSKLYTNSLLSTLNLRRGWMPIGGQDTDDKLTAVNDTVSRKCHLCDGKSGLSSLTLGSHRGGLNPSTTVIAMHGMDTLTRTQKSDAESFTHDNVKVLVESTTDHASA